MGRICCPDLRCTAEGPHLLTSPPKLETHRLGVVGLGDLQELLVDILESVDASFELPVLGGEPGLLVTVVISPICQQLTR